MTEERHAWESGAHEWVDLARNRADGPRLAHDEAIRELLPAPAGPTFDVGCGEGRWTRELRGRGYDVTGFDRSETLPFPDAAFDLVTCRLAFHHFTRPVQAIAEFARVLAPGGVLVAGLIHPVAEAGIFDEDADELRVRNYFVTEEHAVPLGEGHVFHQHRTIEGYLRAFLGAGFGLDDLREIPGRTGSTPRFLDLRLHRT